MNNAAVLVLTAALTMASAWPIVKTVSAAGHANQFAVNHSTDAAYRDGLYLGRLDAEAGRRPHLAIARWNQTADRNLFRAGYNEAYSQAIAMVQ